MFITSSFLVLSLSVGKTYFYQKTRDELFVSWTLVEKYSNFNVIFWGQTTWDLLKHLWALLMYRSSLTSLCYNIVLRSTYLFTIKFVVHSLTYQLIACFYHLSQKARPPPPFAFKPLQFFTCLGIFSTEIGCPSFLCVDIEPPFTVKWASSFKLCAT